MSEDQVDEKHLKARHSPAVKVGGMRITQHHRQYNQALTVEDTTGLTITASPPKHQVVSGVIMKGNVEHDTEAVQHTHKEKPYINPSMKHNIPIFQPRRE